MEREKFESGGMEVIYAKRANEHSDSASSVAGEKKERKTAADEFEVNDALIESIYPPSCKYNRSWCILKAKLRVREFQFYLKSIGESYRARMIRSPEDIVKVVSQEQLKSFEEKGWDFYSIDMDHGDSFDYYRCLSVMVNVHHPYVGVFSTYESDKDYDKFYSAISEQIKVGMLEKELLEVAETVCRTSFPNFQISVAFAACLDCLLSKELEGRRKERAALNLKLWDEVVNNKRDFWDVLHGIFERELASYPYHADVIADDFSDDYESPRCYSIETQFEKFRDFVNANSDDKLEDLAWEFAKKECVILLTYAEYVKEKMRVAKELGILYCEAD